MAREVRTTTTPLRVERRAGKDRPVITGYGVVFAPAKSLDLGGFIEQVDPHAADASLRSKTEVKSFFNHDPMYVLGSTESGTLRLTTDTVGVKFEIDSPPTTWANDLLVSLGRGDIRGASFAFHVEEDEWRTEGKVQLRTLKRIKIIEMGPCTNAAYPAASAGVRAMLKQRGLDPDRLLGRLPTDPRITAKERSSNRSPAELLADLDRMRRSWSLPSPALVADLRSVDEIRRRRQALADRAARDPNVAYRTMQANVRAARAEQERKQFGLPYGSVRGLDGFWRAPE